jgi:mannose-1-phosphate guanylyltransferase
LGDQTLLEETHLRAALELSRERTLCVVSRSHEEFYAPIMAGGPAQNILVQPSNRVPRQPSCTAFYVSQRSILMLSSCSSRLTITFLTTTGSWPTFERHSIPHVQDVVLGLDPESAEAEYGWIEPIAPIIGHSLCWAFVGFGESPIHCWPRCFNFEDVCGDIAVLQLTSSALGKHFEKTYFLRKENPEIPGNKKKAYTGKV